MKISDFKENKGTLKDDLSNISDDGYQRTIFARQFNKKPYCRKFTLDDGRKGVDIIHLATFAEKNFLKESAEYFFKNETPIAIKDAKDFKPEDIGSIQRNGNIDKVSCRTIIVEKYGKEKLYIFDSREEEHVINENYNTFIDNNIDKLEIVNKMNEANEVIDSRDKKSIK